MDFCNTNAIEVTTLALNGLAARHNALAANIANADTPGYKRADVSFESQLLKITDKISAVDSSKRENSVSLVCNMNAVTALNSEFKSDYDKNEFEKIDEAINSFNPEVTQTDTPAVKADGNNVNIDYEMAELAKNGTKFAAITTFQEKMFRGLQDIISRGN